MKNTPNLKVEKHRLTDGTWGTAEANGNNGMFLVPFKSITLKVVASDGGGWDHLSVSVKEVARCPHWDEMKYAYSLFFKEDEWAVQFHPPETKNVNNHETTLHVWRPQAAPIHTPPGWMVGKLDEGPLSKSRLAELANLNVLTQDQFEAQYGVEYPLDEAIACTSAMVAVLTRMTLLIRRISEIIPSLEEESAAMIADAATCVGIQSRFAGLFEDLGRLPDNVREALAPILESMGDLRP